MRKVEMAWISYFFEEIKMELEFNMENYLFS